MFKALLFGLIYFNIATNSSGQYDSIINHKYVILPEILELHPDIKTSNSIKYSYGEFWLVDTIKIMNTYGYSRLRVLLNNKRENFLAIDLKEFVTALDNNKIITASKFLEYQKKFGSSNLKSILEGKVTIGMTKEMVKAAWGEPDKINQTITTANIHEQWIYNSNYLYFDNNKLTAIQQF